MCDTHPLELLRTARHRYTQKQLAEILEVDVRTVRRWEVRESDPPPYLSDAIRQRILPLVDSGNDDIKFRFIDLFAGIGGIRSGFEYHGGGSVSLQANGINFPGKPTWKISLNLQVIRLLAI